MFLDASNSIDISTVLKIGIPIITGVITAVIGGVIGFYRAKAGITKDINQVKDEVTKSINSAKEETNKEITDLKLKVQELHGRDELQQQFLDQFKEVIMPIVSNANLGNGAEQTNKDSNGKK